MATHFRGKTIHQRHQKPSAGQWLLATRPSAEKSETPVNIMVKAVIRLRNPTAPKPVTAPTVTAISTSVTGWLRNQSARRPARDNGIRRPNAARIRCDRQFGFVRRHA